MKFAKTAGLLSKMAWMAAGIGADWLLGREPRTDAAMTVTPPIQMGEPAGAGPASGASDELSQLHERIAALQAGVSALDKQWSRAGREQLKANALAEAQQQQVRAALEQMREQSGRRETELAALRAQLRSDHSAQRLLMVERILPALDGLDEAIASGARMLERAPQIPAPAPPSPLSVRERVAIALGRALPAQAAQPAAAFTLAAGGEWHSAAEAWLHGVRLVRERLLEALDAEGVQPIAARGEQFDPHLHLAIESVPAGEDTPDGSVVAEYRRGYIQGERLLRPAEVVVARADDRALLEAESAAPARQSAPSSVTTTSLPE